MSPFFVQNLEIVHRSNWWVCEIDQSSYLLCGGKSVLERENEFDLIKGNASQRWIRRI